MSISLRRITTGVLAAAAAAAMAFASAPAAGADPVADLERTAGAVMGTSGEQTVDGITVSHTVRGTGSVKPGDLVTIRTEVRADHLVWFKQFSIDIGENFRYEPGTAKWGYDDGQLKDAGESVKPDAAHPGALNLHAGNVSIRYWKVGPTSGNGKAVFESTFRVVADAKPGTYRVGSTMEVYKLIGSNEFKTFDAIGATVTIPSPDGPVIPGLPDTGSGTGSSGSQGLGSNKDAALGDVLTP